MACEAPEHNYNSTQRKSKLYLKKTAKIYRSEMIYRGKLQENWNNLNCQKKKGHQQQNSSFNSKQKHFK